MSTLTLNDLTASTFRANPRYELVPFAQLSVSHQQMMADLRKDPTFYGILRPRIPATLNIKSVGEEVAHLYTLLEQPGPLPLSVQSALGHEERETIARLVLDDVLEIVWQGEFVSGSHAYSALYGQNHSIIPPKHSIARLSLESLQYGHKLQIEDGIQLSLQLYGYNRIPSSPMWANLLPTSAHMIPFLGVVHGGRLEKSMERYWIKQPHTAWLVWTSRQHPSPRDSRAWSYKLYISPVPRDLPIVFRVTAEVLKECRASAFKVGADRYGILRPDKLVAYFDSLEYVQKAATRLYRELKGIGSHGVPFTAELEGDGLLSWGMDPPHEGATVSWLTRESWRLWVTNRLAAALVAAQKHPTSYLPAWQFALERMQLEDVDVATWTPSSHFGTKHL